MQGSVGDESSIKLRNKEILEMMQDRIQHLRTNINRLEQNNLINREMNL